MEDVIGNEQGIQETIESISEESQSKVSIPEKFQGKSLEDVVSSYVALEKELGRKGKEIGELRRLTDQLIQKDLASPVKTQEEKPIKEEDFFDNPKKVVKQLLQEELKPFKESISRSNQEVALSKLNSEHPGWQNLVQEEGFQDWVGKSVIRTRLYQQADAHFDFDAANELISTYKDLQKVEATKRVEEESKSKRKATVKAGSVESGSSGEGSSKIFRRADLIRLRIEDPGKYNDLQPEIMKAYNEGRVR